jgi:hypothetical protein
MSAKHNTIVRVVIKGSLHLQETNNVLHFGFTGLEPNYLQLITDIIDCIFTTLRPAVSEDWKLEMVSAQQLWPVRLDPIEKTPDAVTQGTGLPGGVSFSAYLIRVRTGLGGRTNRGRMYIAGTIENDVNLSRLTDSGLAKVVAFAACMVGKFVTTPTSTKAFEIGVLSRKELAAPLANEQVAFTEATSLVAVREVKSMRSRQIGHGN